MHNISMQNVCESRLIAHAGLRSGTSARRAGLILIASVLLGLLGPTSQEVRAQETWNLQQTLAGSGAVEQAPAIATTDEGVLYAAYEDRSTSPVSVRVLRSPDGGTTWNGYKRIDAGGRDYRHPDVVIGGKDGGTRRLFVASHSQNTEKIYVNRYELDGTGSGQETLTSSGLFGGRDVRPRLAVTSGESGYSVHVIWLEKDGDYNLWYARSTDQGLSYSEEDSKISARSSHADLAAFDETQKLIVACQPSDRTDRVNVFVVTDNGESWPESGTTVSDSDDNAEKQRVRVAAGGSSEAMVIYEYKSTIAGWQIHASATDDLSSWFSDKFAPEVDDISTGLHQQRPSIFTTDGSTYHVTYYGGSDAQGSIFYEQASSPSGSEQEIEVSEDGGVSPDGFPAITAGPNGRAAAIWTASSGSGDVRFNAEAPLTGPKIALDPTSYDFGGVLPGETASTSFTLQNDGARPMSGTVELASSDPSAFTITQGAGSYTLNSGESLTIRVKFAPSETASYTDSLSVSHNANNRPSPVQALLEGTGTTDTSAPPAPNDLTAQSDTGRVDLQWAPVAAEDLAFYHVYRSKQSGSGTQKEKLAEIEEGSTTYVDTAVTNGTDYYYQVTAVDTVGNESNFSNEASAHPPLERPDGLIATAGDQAVTLDWEAVSGKLEDYRVYQGSGNDASVIATVDVGITTYQVSGLNNGTTYTFSVSAVDSSGIESNRSEEVEATPKGDNTPPPPPSGVLATAVPDTANLRWVPSDTVSDLRQYRVYRDTQPIDSLSGPSNYAALTNVNASDTSFSDVGVQNGTTYYYRITAVDSSGNESGFSRGAVAQPKSILVTAVYPNSGASGTTVHLYGRGFNSTPSGNTVTFDDTEATVLSAAARTLRVRVPSGVNGLTEVSIDNGTASAAVTSQFAVVNRGGKLFSDIEANLEGVAPASSDWGDYDSDGDLDLVISGDGETTIYRNDGNRDFVPIDAGIANIDEFGGAVEWGDYDSDGDLDLAVVGDSEQGKGTRIYQNEGDGTFESLDAGLVEYSLASAAWGDYDSDGDLDLIISGLSYETLNKKTVLYRNDGGGTFTSVDVGIVGVTDGSLEWGDYDTDGDLDLVISGSTANSSTTTIYRNDGGGEFTAIEAGIADLLLPSVSWGDYDADGDLDLAATGSGNSLQSSRIYENQGSGNFVSASVEIQAVTNGSLDWGDYDADGDLDLLVTGTAAVGQEDIATIYRNDGEGAFTAVDAGLQGVYVSSSEWGDYDSDGDLDLVITGIGENDSRTATIYENVPIPAPSDLSASPSADGVNLRWTSADAPDVRRYRVYRSLQPFDEGASPSEYAAYDSTAATDTTFTDQSAGTEYYYRVTAVDSSENESKFSNRGVPLFTPVEGPFIGVENSSSSIGDVNNDGRADLVITGEDENLDPTAKLYLGGEDGNFTEAGAGLAGVISGSSSLGDVDGDGNLDILVTGDQNGLTTDGGFSSTLYLGDGEGGFSKAEAGLVGVRSGSSSIKDVNNDGNPDLLITGRNENSNPSATLYLGDGEGGFSEANAGLTGVSVSSSSIADVNKDGNADLLITGRDASRTLTATLYLGSGDGSFTEAGAGLTGVLSGDSSFGDVDGDGNPDLLIVGDKNGGNTEGGTTATLYLGNRQGSFTEAHAGLIGGTRSSAVIDDVNGDGNSDILISGDNGALPLNNIVRMTTLYLGDGQGNFIETGAGLPDVNKGSFSIGDVDNDGSNDLLVTGDDGDALDPVATLYKNVRERADPSPTAPTGLVATAGDEQVDLTWRSGGSSNPDGYNVYRSTSSFSEISDATRINGSPISDTTYTDTNVSNGASYYYRVTAVLGGVESNLSDQVNATPSSAVPLTVAGLQPTSGTPGTTVRIYGRGFGSSPSDNTVTFGSIEATVEQAASGVLRVQVPSGARGPVEVSVSNGRTAMTIASRFTIVVGGEGTFENVVSEFSGMRNASADWGDYDQDGDLDLVVVGHESSGPSTLLYRNDDGSFTEVGGDLVDLKRGSADWGDYDGDGDLDLVLTGSDGTASAAVLYRNESGSFARVGAGLEGVKRSSADWGDYDGDGDLDLVVTGSSGSGPVTLLYRNDGDGSFSRSSAGLPGFTFSAVEWGDYDGDSDLDLAVAGFDPDGTRTAAVYRNQGDGDFNPVGAGLTGVADPGDDFVDWGDYDQDGDLDLVVAGLSSTGETATIYRNESGSFVPVEAGLTGIRGGSAQWGDLNGDGALDLFVVGGDGETETATTYLNDDGTFAPVGPGFAGTFQGTVAIGDANGDGQLDLYVSGQGPQGSLVGNLYRNRGAGRNPDHLTINVERTFGDASGAEDYRLVSLPGAIDRSLAEVVDGRPGADWQAFWDNGAVENYLLEHDGSETFDFRPGRGFWLASRQPWTVTDTIETVFLGADQATAIPLHDGWNIISNPLGVDVAWSAVNAANGGGLEPAWYFNGSFGIADSIWTAATGQAYYFLNDQNLDSLKVPYPTSVAGGEPYPASMTDGKSPTDSSGSPSVLRLVATSDEMPRSAVRVGVADGASAGRDEQDVVAPPTRFSALSLCARLPGKDPSGRRNILATDLRPSQERNHKYSLRLRAEPQEKVTLRIRGRTQINGRSVALIDPSSGRSHDLRRADKVTLTMTDSTRTLRLVIGSGAYVKNQERKVVPDKVMLTSYPNPMRRQATLEYTLPEAQEVRLAVYDVLGRRVAVLERGRKEAGRHRVRLEGDRLSSGVYFGRLRVDGQTLTQKITVVR